MSKPLWMLLGIVISYKLEFDILDLWLYSWSVCEYCKHYITFPDGKVHLERLKQLFKK